MVRRRLAVLLVLALAGCAVRGAPPAGWQAPLGREHPLAGRIWDVDGDRFVAPAALTGRLAAARFVLLGERHDHPDHHRLQAEIVRALVDAGRRPAVAFEMLTTDQAPALARHLATAPRDAAGLGAAVGWGQSGWPDWVLYQPIADVALGAGLPIVAANLPPALARAVAREGLAPLPATFVERFALACPLPDEAGLADEIRAGHCHHLPEARISRMVLAQRARDAHMAGRLLEAPPDGAVLIVGAGHVHRERGVPHYLRGGSAAGPVVSVAFVEVVEGHHEAREYARRGGARPAFDYLWFTARMDDEDACARFRR